MRLLFPREKKGTLRVKDGKLVLPAEPDAPVRVDLTKFSRELKALPDGLKARTLILTGCTQLGRLPEGLEVSRLDLGGCTGLTSLPAGLRCFDLNLKGT